MAITYDVISSIAHTNLFIEFIPSYGSRSVFGRMFLLSSSVDPSLFFYRSCSPLRMVPSGYFIFGSRRMILLGRPQFFTGPESQRPAENSDGRGLRTRDLTINLPASWPWTTNLMWNHMMWGVFTYFLRRNRDKRRTCREVQKHVVLFGHWEPCLQLQCRKLKERFLGSRFFTTEWKSAPKCFVIYL